MPNVIRDVLLRHLRGAAAGPRFAGRSDGELLRAFAEGHDQDAFAEIVRRRGPTVLQVCRRVLRHAQDAEDAFQATFALLARNPGAVRKRDSLGSWLHGVAYRMALHARRAAARRRKQEGRAEPSRVTARARDEGWQEVQALLHEEIERLPDIYRAAFVLCSLENRSGEEAARELGIKPGTVSSRLTKARQLLRSRLARRGVDLAAVLAGLALWGARSAVAAPLACRTVRAATAYAAQGPGAAGALSAGAAALLKGRNTAMLLNKIKAVVAVLAVLGLGGAGLGLAAREPGKEQGTPAAQAPAADARPEPDTAGAQGRGNAAKAGGPYAGAVLDPASGKPVAGVKVVARRLIEGKPAGEVRLTSDREGRFRFEPPASWAEPADARIAVRVEAPPGYVGFPYRKEFGRPTDDGVTVEQLRRQKELGVQPYFDKVLLFPTKQITGRLEDPDGKPAADVQVVACSIHLKDKAVPPHRLVRRTRTDAAGRFTAEVASPGPVVLYFLPERYAARYVKLTDPAGDLGAYKLEAGVEVAGKLRDVKDRPLPGRWVRVGITSYPPDADGELWRVGIGGFARWCRTDPGGTFRTAPLPPGEYEVSAHGIDGTPRVGEPSEFNPGWDALLGRERVGQPLDACVLPQKVAVRAGKAPPVVLRAVPHVNVELRVADRDGKPRDGTNFPYRFDFDGKQYWNWVESPVARGGKVVVRVPHGATSFMTTVIESGPADICVLRPTQGAQVMGGMVFLKDLEADRALDFVWMPGVDTSVRVTAKDGSPLRDVELSADHPLTKDGNGKITATQRPLGCLPTGDGVYWLWGAVADRPLLLRVRAEGYEEVTRTVTLAAGAPRRIEIVLAKKKAK